MFKNKNPSQTSQQVVSSNREELMFQLITVTLPQIQFGWGCQRGFSAKIVGKGWVQRWLIFERRMPKHHTVHKERYDMTLNVI